MSEGEEKRSERLHQSVARELGTQILTGRYSPGEPFAREIEQSAAMGVSRTAYREAIRILTAKGLLESRPKVGTHVTPRSKWNILDPDVLAWMFSKDPDAQFVRDLFELRRFIEPGAAELAALRRTDHQITQMSDCIEVMCTAPLATQDWQRADRQFHRLLLEATHNQALITLGSSIGTAVELTTRFKLDGELRPHDPVPDHVAVFTAVDAGDASGARSAMEDLLKLAFQDMNLQN